jgi:peroxiredoxin Q/BCP
MGGNMPAIGETAPDFELLNQDGETIRLNDYRGKKVIIFAYPKADTSGCTIQACGFRDEFPKVEAGNAMVFGLSPDDLDALVKWKAKQNFQYDLLSDPDHKVLEGWGAWGEKTSFGNTTIGVIRSHWVIDENGVVIDEQIKISPEQSVEKAVAAVMA